MGLIMPKVIGANAKYLLTLQNFFKSKYENIKHNYYDRYYWIYDGFV
jgi:hypothetical protein